MQRIRVVGWIIDGNYNDRAPELLDAADMIVWLDYARWLVMARVIRRTVVRLGTRQMLWNGNRERLRRIFTPDAEDNIVLWAWTQHAPVRRRYLAAMGENAAGRWVRLRTPRDARAWVRSLQ